MQRDLNPHSTAMKLKVLYINDCIPCGQKKIEARSPRFIQEQLKQIRASNQSEAGLTGQKNIIRAYILATCVGDIVAS